jgi:hypothetical protein
MQTGGASAIKIILWILAANAVLILSAYGLVVWWRKQARDAIHKISERIQGFASQMDQLAGFLNAYMGIDQEPFFTPLEALQKEASGLEERVQNFLDTCRAFEEELAGPPPNQFQGIITAPLIWFRRWRRSIDLQRESEEIDQQMASSEERMQTIFELPWELAAECRQANKEVSELLQNIQKLQGKGVRGINYQKVASQGPLIQQALSAIPAVFLQASKEDLLATANLASTIQVFETLTSLRPALDRYLPQLREWHINLEKASSGYAELKHVGANLRQALTSPPPGLVVAPLQERLDQVAQMATEVNQRLTQPDADMLKSLAREVSQLRKVLQDTEQQYSRAGQQVTELHRAVEDLNIGLEKLFAQFSALEHSESFPLVWDESTGPLNELRQKLQAIGPAQQPRTPDQVLLQRAQVEGLTDSYKRLAEKIPQAAIQHTGLLALLDSAEIRGGTAWLRKTGEVLDQAANYDPKNWPKKESPLSLPEELAELERLQIELSPLDRKSPVKESTLAQRLKDTQQLASLHKSLHTRVENVRVRLEKMQALEEQSKDLLTGSWSALEKVALLAESNDLLEEIISAEIDQLGEEIRQLGNELNNHNQGEIDKKAQRIQLQAEKNNQALNQWIARLNTAALDQSKQISDRLIQLDAITHLDEPPVEDARSLLQREEVNLLRSGSSPATSSVVGRVATRIAHTETRPVFNDLEALAELKRKNDLWQMLAACQFALEEKSTALLAAYQDAVQSRSETRDRLAEVAKNFPDKRSWPPNNQAPLLENQVMQPIDEKWDALKKKSTRAEMAILELGRLVQQYHHTTERAAQVLNRIQQDHERIQDLEWQIDAVKQRWQSQVDPANSILRAGIQSLISQSDSKLASIKQQYMRGTLSYEQSIQNLQLLYDELFSAQVPVDERNKIGLNEPHRRVETQP